MVEPSIVPTCQLAEPTIWTHHARTLASDHKTRAITRDKGHDFRARTRNNGHKTRSRT
ncbi:unnamed protein product [Lupinus luteus]|uniref:Uncharacterized protein n=1 Tax=Lupinus luteus TaxID=3873 RepID=A0AAV1YKR9_LUPLU